jgi:hypothetical protein
MNVDNEDDDGIISEQQNCLDCSSYLPASNDEFTEFGICLNDDAFEPFIEELLQGPIPDSCQALVQEKKFEGERHPACSDFRRVESFEIDDNTPLGQKLRRLQEEGKLNADSLEAAVFEERVKQIDCTTLSVDEYVSHLESVRPEERDKAISSLGALIALENSEAFQALLRFLANLPPPAAIGDVHLKMEILRRLSCAKDKAAVAAYLIEELGRTPSNNTTRQWILDILRFLDRCPSEVIKEPLERMLAQKQFSFKLRKRILDMIS